MMSHNEYGGWVERGMCVCVCVCGGGGGAKKGTGWGWGLEKEKKIHFKIPLKSCRFGVINEAAKSWCLRMTGQKGL